MSCSVNGASFNRKASSLHYVPGPGTVQIIVYPVHAQRRSYSYIVCRNQFFGTPPFRKIVAMYLSCIGIMISTRVPCGLQQLFGVLNGEES